jgi:sugar lactone lactonase YvrE
VVATAQGEIYIAEAVGNRVRKVLADGTIQTVAGNGKGGFRGDGGPAIQARISGPQGIALDSHGNLYISDSGNHRVRRVLKDGTLVATLGSSCAGPLRV